MRTPTPRSRRFMQILLTLLVAAAAHSTLHAQSLTLFDIDASAHPTMRAKFYAFDAQGNVQRPLATDLAVTERGVPRTVTSVSCLPPVPPRALSSVLVLDVSSSMSFGFSGTLNIDLAKIAARSWVNAMPLGNSECAIVSFDGANYLNQDFTTDLSKLLNAIDKLQPQGGTNYDRALIELPAGGLAVSKYGKHQRLIVLVTDGDASNPNVSAIVNEANRQSCIIYCVTLGLPAPQSLRAIAEQTGGQVFENVTTPEHAEQVYQYILFSAQSTAPCIIEWKSGKFCQATSTNVDLSLQGRTARGRYALPATANASLEVSPSWIHFDRPPIGMPVTQEVVVTSKNATFTVTGVNLTNSAYSITPTKFSLQPNESRTLTLTYVAPDSGYTFTGLTLENDFCPKTFFASSGYVGTKPNNPTLRLTSPNGGESFIAGSDTVITWEGISPSALVELDYSTDDGTTWTRIDTARGLSYRWINVPRPASNTCRVRVKQLSSTLASGTEEWSVIHTLLGHDRAVNRIAFSPDGNILASASDDYTVKLWNPFTGQEIQTLPGHESNVSGVAFSPDGKVLASGSYDGIVRLWNTSSGQLIRTLICGSGCYSLAFSPDGSTLASGSYQGNITMWDLSTAQEIRNQLRFYTIYSLAFSPDGSKLGSVEDNRVKLWDPVTGNEIRTLTSQAQTGTALCVVFSSDNLLAFSGRNGSIEIYDPETGQLIRTLNGHAQQVFDVDIHPDGSMLASGGDDRIVKIWDVSNGREIRRLIGHTGAVNGAAFSPDGNMLASSSEDQSIKLWTVGGVAIQADRSDAVFSIVEPLAEASDINLGQCLVGSAKDSVVVDLVRNVGTYPFEVRSVSFTGPDAAAFALVAGIPTYRVDAATFHFGEFRFEPTRVGLHQAQLVIVTQSDTLVQNIQGTGVAPQLAIVSTLVDFGRIPATTSKDTLRVATVRNVGNAPLTITDVRHAGPNDTDFTTITGGGSFVLQPGDTHLMDLRFTANNVGRTSGTLEFSYNDVGSPAVVQLFAEGADTVRTTIALPNITAHAGQLLDVPLSMVDHTSLDMPSAPRRFLASFTLNPTVVHVTDPSLTCTAVDAYRCEYTIAGSRGTSDTLVLIPAVVTLGVTDFAPIELTAFQWMDAGDTVIITTLDGSIRLTDICDEGGTRLYVPGNTGYSLASRPNPAQSVAELQFGLAGAGPVVVDVIDQTGRLVLTPVNEAALPAGLHTRTVDVSTLSNGPYVLLLRSGNTTLTSRLDVVR